MFRIVNDLPAYECIYLRTGAYDRLTVTVKKRRESARRTREMVEIVHARFGVHPYLAALHSTLGIDLYESFVIVHSAISFILVSFDIS